MRLRAFRIHRRARRDQMTCRRAVSLVTAYLDGVLPRGDLDRLERHLDECPHCWEHLRQIEATILLAGGARVAAVDPNVRDGLLEVYRRWHGPPG